MATLAKKLPPYLRWQAAYRLICPFEQGTVKSVCKRYKITPQELKSCVRDFIKCKYKRLKSAWNPLWDTENFYHHIVDTAVMVDIQNGSEKGSDSDLLMDPGFDAINGILHLEWTEEHINTLCASLPYRILEIIRDSRPGDELYEEAILFAKSEFFTLICKHFGLDSEELIKQAIEISRRDIF